LAEAHSITYDIIRRLIREHRRRWCVTERRPTGPDLIYYLAHLFQNKEDAEKKRDELAALPEKRGYMLDVTLYPGSELNTRRGGSPRRHTRRDHR